MENTHQRLLRLVRENLDHLQSLLPPEEAEEVMAKVRRYLEEGAAIQLRRLLQHYPPVRDWMDQALYGENLRYAPLPGNPEPPFPALRYVCPCRGCSYEKLLPHKPLSPPTCPVHQAALVLFENKGPGQDCS